MPHLVTEAAERAVSSERRAEPRPGGIAGAEPLHLVAPGRPRWMAALQALRPLHWAKNLLVFVPFLEGHHTRLVTALSRSVVTFLAFCLIASSGYVFNDLLDLEADRRHPKKARRPLAAGELSPAEGLGLFALLAALGLGLAVWLPAPVLRVVIAYWLGSIAYSLFLRPVVILDVMALAGLFTLRLLAGGLAEGAPVFLHLQWISLFLFFSLALVKRTAEIRAYRRTGCEPSSRAYRRADMAPVAVVGTASGMAAVVFGAVFVAGPEARQLYDHPEVLWLAVPLAASWMLRLWLLAWRGEIDEDPVAFVAKDRVSYAVAVLALAVIGASL